MERASPVYDRRDVNRKPSPVNVRAPDAASESEWCSIVHDWSTVETEIRMDRIRDRETARAATMKRSRNDDL